MPSKEEQQCQHDQRTELMGGSEEDRDMNSAVDHGQRAQRNLEYDSGNQQAGSDSDRFA